MVHELVLAGEMVGATEQDLRPQEVVTLMQSPMHGPMGCVLRPNGSEHHIHLYPKRDLLSSHGLLYLTSATDLVSASEIGHVVLHLQT